MASGGPRLDDLASGPLAATLDRWLASHEHVALAVSGGSDSVALMQLAAAIARRVPAVFDAVTIITVDHRLRAGSGAEAEQVRDIAAAIGFARHVTLPWSGPHPETGIQAAAREARYRLICDYCKGNGISAFATAHTLDDQAETVLMRLARGSGIDGLAGMAKARPLGDLVHERPLLATSRADLRAWLLNIGASWIDDPSNDNPAFERIRWRQARETLETLGLTDRAVALTADRAARAKAAIEWVTEREVAQAGNNLELSTLGFARISRAWLNTLPSEIRLRIVGPLIEALGGQATPPPLAALEAACDGIGNSTSAFGRGFTLHGAMVRSVGASVVILREPIGLRRKGTVPYRIAHMPLAPGTVAVWDNRFSIALAQTSPEAAVVAPLGTEGLAALRRAKVEPALRGSARVLVSLPQLIFARSGVAVPHLGEFPPGVEPGMVQVCPVRVPFPTRANDGGGTEN